MRALKKNMWLHLQASVSFNNYHIMIDAIISFVIAA